MVPSLLAGAGTWTGITSTEVDRLDGLQDLFWRVMFKVPESCPRIALRAETRMISMKHRIWEAKLLLIRRIKRQSQGSLSWKIWKEQVINKWPGLSAEVMDICKQLDIPNINENSVEGDDIKKAVFRHHMEEVKEKVGSSKKMQKHKDDDFETVQEYMKGKSVEKTRMAFRVRCEMVDTIKGNYKDKYRRKRGEKALLCTDCSEQEVHTQTHCLTCPKWERLREGMEMDTLENMVIFFQRLIMERLKKDNGS